MILMPDLFSFAYVPNWYSQLDMLAEMALPEPWRFKNPIYLTKNPDTPILERYIHAIFKKQLIDYKDERNPSSAADYFHIENEFCCFHTGLYTRRYKAKSQPPLQVVVWVGPHKGRLPARPKGRVSQALSLVRL